RKLIRGYYYYYYYYYYCPETNIGHTQLKETMKIPVGIKRVPQKISESFYYSVLSVPGLSRLIHNWIIPAPERCHSDDPDVYLERGILCYNRSLLLRRRDDTSCVTLPKSKSETMFIKKGNPTRRTGTGCLPSN
ncbi:MAG TPA: hypothetical protein PLK12_05185, partial [Prolixibacteraceae bacterium]|nr:hypothetical protein [Prolixibacteraceae bacterium]